MRTGEIFHTGTYWTMVSGARTKVRILADYGGRGGRYLLVRADTGATLPKLRSAKALHPTGTGYWPGMTEAQD